MFTVIKPYNRAKSLDEPCIFTGCNADLIASTGKIATIGRLLGDPYRSITRCRIEVSSPDGKPLTLVFNPSIEIKSKDSAKVA